MTKIEWTHGEGYKGETWNLIVGCTKVSAGCVNCYAIRDQWRMSSNPNPKISDRASGLTKKLGNSINWTGQVKFIEERLNQPLRWNKPRMVFVNSQGDLFHESVSDEQLDQIFAVMALANWHVYMVLTKRPQRMVEYFSKTPSDGNYPVGFETQYNIEYHANGMADSAEKSIKLPLPNVYLGVTCENQKAADERIPLLQKVPAAVRFVSFEPLLEPITLDVRHQFQNINWAILGGESGPKARKCAIEWLTDLEDRCTDYGVARFVKQLGSKPTLAGETYPVTGKGGDPEQWPEHLRIRQWPLAD